MSSSKAAVPVIPAINERSSITEIMSVLRNCIERKEFGEVDKLLIALETRLRKERDDLRSNFEVELKKDKVFKSLKGEQKIVEDQKTQMAKEIKEKDKQIEKLNKNLKEAQLKVLKIEKYFKEAKMTHRIAEEQRMQENFERDKKIGKKKEQISTQTKNPRVTELKRRTIVNDSKESERKRFRIEAEKQKMDNVRLKENQAIQMLTEAEKLIRLLHDVLKREGKTIPALDKCIANRPDADVGGLMENIRCEDVKREVEEICQMPSAETAMRSSDKKAFSDDTDQANSAFEGGKQDVHCGIDTRQLESEKFKRYKETKTGWNSVADMLTDFQNDFKLCMAAVCALYRRKLEQSNIRPMFLEDSDSTSLKTLAEYLINRHPLNELSKTVEDVRQEAPIVLSMCKNLAVRYRDILFDIHTMGGDHLFRPDL